MGRREEEGCVERSEGGEREQGWGTPMHLEHRRNSWRKRVGIREFGILEGSTPLSQIWLPHLLHTLQSCRKNPDFGEVDFGSPCCAILASSFPSLASQFAHLYIGLGTGRGAGGMREGGSSLQLPS